MVVPRPVVNVLAWIGAFHLTLTAVVVVGVVARVAPEGEASIAAGEVVEPPVERPRRRNH